MWFMWPSSGLVKHFPPGNKTRMEKVVFTHFSFPNIAQYYNTKIYVYKYCYFVSTVLIENRLYDQTFEKQRKWETVGFTVRDYFSIIRWGFAAFIWVCPTSKPQCFRAGPVQLCWNYSVTVTHRGASKPFTFTSSAVIFFFPLIWSLGSV